MPSHDRFPAIELDPDDLRRRALDMLDVELRTDPARRRTRAPQGDLHWLHDLLINPAWRDRLSVGLRGLMLDAWDTEAPLTRLIVQLALLLDPPDTSELSDRRTQALAALRAELSRPLAERTTDQDDATLRHVLARLEANDWFVQMIGVGRVVLPNWPPQAPLTLLLHGIAHYAEQSCAAVQQARRPTAAATIGRAADREHHDPPGVRR